MGETAEFICSEDIGDEFTIIPQTQTFEQASIACAGLNSTVARISSVEEFFFVLATAVKLEQASGSAWIGVQAPRNQGGTAANYQFTDNSNVSTAFFQRDGNFPWTGGEPNTTGASCATMALGLGADNLWVDEKCSFLNKPICRRPCSNLTTSPTSAPVGADPVDVGNESSDVGSDDTVDSIQIGLFGVMAVAVVAFVAMMLYVKKELSHMKVTHKQLADPKEDEEAA